MEEKRSYFTKGNELTPENFSEIKNYELRRFQKYTFIMFYAPWCRFCKETKELWKKLIASKSDLGIDVKAYNCEKHSIHKMKINMDYSKKYKTPLIITYPTLVLYKDGIPYKKFTKERTPKNIVDFCIKHTK